MQQDHLKLGNWGLRNIVNFMKLGGWSKVFTTARHFLCSMPANLFHSLTDDSFKKLFNIILPSTCKSVLTNDFHHTFCVNIWSCPLNAIHSTHLLVDMTNFAIFVWECAYQAPHYVFLHPILSVLPLSQIQTFFSEPCSQYPEFPWSLDTNIIFEYSHLFLTSNIEKANSIVHSFLLIYSTVCYKLHFYKKKNFLIHLTEWFLQYVIPRHLKAL
jgi:hypothetical protein